MLERVDDLFLHDQPACERVEFDPAFKGQTIGKLLMIETRAGSATRPAPDLHRNCLPSGTRRNLPGQTIKMPLGLSPCDDCLRQRSRSQDIDHGTSPRPRKPTKEDGP